jgi:hypothetical protein
VLIRHVNDSIADPEFQARLAHLGGTALGGSAGDFGKLISDEIKKWGRGILAANMKRSEGTSQPTDTPAFARLIPSVRMRFRSAG